ncbi:hypothetical protein QQZ08_003014 [Neonectria magnoliae]|uniref:F-box domain-containing protein n=1 Tax=Neonectria magnoliae TaxID=2732573 RepID=A0ABR1IAK7_9HYPO
MASPLLSSPTDILRLILASLSSSTLHKLCLVHTDLRSLAERFLYASIHWTWTESQTPPIILLLRSILRRPELAAFIQNLTLNGATFERNQHHSRRESPKLLVAEEDLDGLVRCIERIDVPYGDLWIQEMRAGSMNAFVALLLSQLPDLRSLHLGKNFTRETLLVGMMLRSALCDKPTNHCLPSYEHLKDVSIAHFTLGIDIGRYTHFRNIADVLPLFYLPSVERITASVDNPVTFAWPAAHPPSLSKLTSMNLAMIREGNLGQVLSAASGLQKLRWDWCYREDLRDRFVTDAIDLDRIATDLSHVRNTLAELTISAASDMVRAEPEFPPLRITGQFNAFRNLTALKRLEVPLPFLLGFSPSRPDMKLLSDVLPPNIEFLTITDDLYLQQEWEWRDVHLLQVLRSWLQDWRTSTPHLRGFRLLLKIMDYEEWGPPMRQELRDLGSQVGVQIKITKLAGSM